MKQIPLSSPLYKLRLMGQNFSHLVTELGSSRAHSQTQSRVTVKSRILSTGRVEGGDPKCSSVTGTRAAALPERECGVKRGQKQDGQLMEALADELGLGLQGEGKMLKGGK